MARYRVGLETRERILAATREALCDMGLENATLKAITDRAGVGAGSFYNLFDTKEQAILQVLREAIIAVDPDPSGMGHETLDDLLDAFVEFITGETAPLARIHLQLISGSLTNPTLADGMFRSHRRRVERFAAAIRRAEDNVTEADAERHAEQLLAALTGLSLRWMLDEKFDFTAHVEALPRRPVTVASPS